MATYIGIDLGTSGCRAIAIDADGAIRAQADTPLPTPEEQRREPEVWWRAVATVIKALCAQPALGPVVAVAVDGTSGTLLLSDEAGRPLGEALLYNDTRASVEAARIAAVAPPDSPARGATSALARLLYLQARCPGEPRFALHQADWIMGRLLGRYGISDENNALKLGYDVVTRSWPAWLQELGVPTRLLPRVLPPARVAGHLDRACARALGLPKTTRVCTGTTDGVAAFLATGASDLGDAVTSLGSTLVLKVLAERPVFAPRFGVYSHRLGDRWLAGGASNSGGAVLRQYFSTPEIETMTAQLRPTQPTGLTYYPLPGIGERFPINDPQLEAALTPRPTEDLTFFQGLLEGIADIEARGYRLLAELGAPYPRRVLSTGGGAHNPAWREIRAARLGVAVELATHDQAAYGTALLARQGVEGAHHD